LRQRGIPYLDRSTYEVLHSQNPEFPAFEQIRQLSIREATLLFHWIAPAQVLGAPPEIRVNKEIIVGASEGDPADHIKNLESLLHNRYTDNSNALLRPLTETDRVVSLSFGAAKFIDWKALVVDGPEYRLIVDSRFVIVRG
jgi:hypothetical protein